METASDVLELILNTGLTMKDVQQITGLSKSALYSIRDGTRSGETSLPILRQLLEARAVPAAPAPPMPAALPAPTIVESMPPGRQQLPTTYTPPAPPAPTYAPGRNSHLTPERLFAEQQATRAEVAELKRLILQQQKSAYQPARVIGSGAAGLGGKKYDPHGSLAHGITALIELTGQALGTFLASREEKNQLATRQESPRQLPAPARQPYQLPAPSAPQQPPAPPAYVPPPQVIRQVAGQPSAPDRVAQSAAIERLKRSMKM